MKVKSPGKRSVSKRLLVTKATLGTPFSNIVATQTVIMAREMISVLETFVSNQAIDNDWRQMPINKVMEIQLVTTERSSTFYT